MTTFKAAQKLIKDRALGKYHYRAVQLLSKLVMNTYSKTQPDRDIETVSITKKIVTIQGWLGDISTRQLRTLFAQIEEIKVIKREPGKITVMLNLEPLKSAEPCADIAKRTAKQHKADRAVKARAQRAKLRKRKTERKTFAIIGRCFGFVLNGAQSEGTRRKHSYPDTAVSA